MHTRANQKHLLHIHHEVGFESGRKFLLGGWVGEVVVRKIYGGLLLGVDALRKDLFRSREYVRLCGSMSLLARVSGLRLVCSVCPCVCWSVSELPSGDPRC